MSVPPETIQIAYAVAATPRSGTQYIARVLTHLGLNCSHEKYFLFELEGAGFPDDSAVCGESSSHVAPHLPRLPPHVAVLHQLRHPVGVVQSHVDLGWLSNKRVAAREGVLEFFRRTSGWGDFDRYATALERAAWFWHYYNLLIERNAGGRRYLRYRLEDVDAGFLARLIGWLGLPPPPLERITRVVADVSRSTNERSGEKADAARRFVDEPVRVTWELLPPAVRLLAERYGYTCTPRGRSGPPRPACGRGGRAVDSPC